MFASVYAGVPVADMFSAAQNALRHVLCAATRWQRLPECSA